MFLIFFPPFNHKDEFWLIFTLGICLYIEEDASTDSGEKLFIYSYLIVRFI